MFTSFVNNNLFIIPEVVSCSQPTLCFYEYMQCYVRTTKCLLLPLFYPHDLTIF